tara:strand:- start:758 stop:1795 length:1038 start_codon:yes stop_codon:yes gene_type:complete
MVTVTTSVDSLKIGEIGDKIVEIHESTTRLSYDLSASMVSQITVSVHDADFEMYRNNYFMIGRTVEYLSQLFEISDVDLVHGNTDSVNFTARLQATQAMRRDRGPMSWGQISPSTFASLMADKFGLDKFMEDTSVDGAIIREHNDKKDESTFDVLRRLANALDFRFFEAKGVLYFASEEFIVSNTDSFTINIPSDSTDAYFGSRVALKRSTDTKKASTAQLSLIQNSSTLSIYPGASFEIKGVPHYEGKYMVDRVTFQAGPTSIVSVSGTNVLDSDDMACALENFQQGSKGECVKRIQIAVGVTSDGDFGPLTKAAVIKYQSANGLTADGIVGPLTWDKIMGIVE